MSFTSNTLNELTTVVATALRIVFPEQEWSVIPEINPEKGQIGFFISTVYAGTDKVIVSRPMVNILTPWELGQPTLLSEVIAAFGKEFENAKSAESGVSETAVTESASPVAEAAPAKKRGRPAKVKV